MFLTAMTMALMVTQGGAQQFDLICSGQMDSWGADQVITRKESVSRARIDLERNLWCWDACERVFVIDHVDAVELKLADARRPDGGRTEITVDRITGRFYNSISIRDPMHFDTMTIGKCEPAPYTVIPRAAF